MAEGGAAGGGGVGAAVVKEGKLFKRGENWISVSPFLSVRIHFITVVREGISMI